IVQLEEGAKGGDSGANQADGTQADTRQSGTEQAGKSAKSASKSAGNTSDEAAGSDDRTPGAAASSDVPAAGSKGSSSGDLVTVSVPDIGDATDVEVIEIMVAVGDTVAAEQSLITVESDKASMEVPSSHAGVVTAIKVKLGDKVNQGSDIIELRATGAAANAEPAQAKPAAAPARTDEPAAAAAPSQAEPSNGASLASTPPERHSPTEAFAEADVPLRNLPHASPSVRKFARELGVNLASVRGTGTKNRITQDDVRQYVKQALAGGAGAGAAATAPTAGGGLNVLGWPKVDFAKFGDIEAKPLSRIKKISGANLHRNWVMIPHVTNNDQADITELEELRQTLNKENEKSGVKVTMLAFLIKAVVAALKKFPEFNASLDGDNLVYKQYYHVGFAADTPNGLVVPVLRDADKKGIVEIAKETAELAKLARDGKLAP